MTLDSLHHIGLCVNNIDEAIDWYSTSFSCEILHKDQTSAIIRFNNINLEIFLPSQNQKHLAFSKSNAEEFGELVPKKGEYESCYISDSSGNIVELVKN